MEEKRNHLARLPPELLVMIVDMLAEAWRATCGEAQRGPKKGLLSLRLCDRRVARLKQVDSLLFEHLHLPISPEGVARLKKADFTRMAPYTRAVTIVIPEPPEASSDTDEEQTRTHSNKAAADDYSAELLGVKFIGLKAKTNYTAPLMTKVVDQVMQKNTLWGKSLKQLPNVAWIDYKLEDGKQGDGEKFRYLDPSTWSMMLSIGDRGK